MAVSCKLQAYLLFVWFFCSGFYTILCSYVAGLVLLAMLHEVFYLAMACITVVCSDIRFANSTQQRSSAAPLGDASGTQTVISRAVRSEPNIEADCHELDMAKPEPNNGESELQPEGAAETSDTVACHDFVMARTTGDKPNGDGIQPEENDTGDSEAIHDFDMSKPAEDEPKRNELQPKENETGINETSPGLDAAQPGEAEPGNDGGNHAVDVAPPMDANVALVQRVLAYSQMKDKALGDRLIFQLAPEVYQRQGLKCVYDRLRWQANPHRHLLGGEYRALAFKAFEHLHAVYRRLEEAQMLTSGCSKD
ncbi:hypothetical protein Vafri_13355 [Volvox africanus]|nr:hypothetical protein Vafri_13355 [Volvox africanus]